MLKKILLVCVFSAFSSAEPFRYDNYTLFKVHPGSEEHLQFLKDLQDERNDLDFWKAPGRVGDYVSVLTPPEARAQFQHSLDERSIYSQVMLDNIQEAIDAQTFSRKKRSTDPSQMYWTNYQTIEEIYEWLDHLSQTYPNVVSVITVGSSSEGRNIKGIKISRGSGRKAFFLEAGQIGADWLSPTVLTYIADQLIRGVDPEARAASEDFDWYIFPVSNPDGHQFTQDSVRLWLKNRRPVTRTAIGVDMTRNWNSQWGVSGGSFTPADNNYHGLGPFSEPETRAYSRFIEGIGGDLVGVLSFRGFGQRLLIPFAHTTGAEAGYNYEQMMLIGRRAMGALSVRYGTQYIVGTSRDVHDGATGAIADWAKHRFNPPIAATFLLRDNGAWGYTLPVVQVQPSCEETFDAVIAIVREAKWANVI